MDGFREVGEGLADGVGPARAAEGAVLAGGGDGALCTFSNSPRGRASHAPSGATRATICRLGSRRFSEFSISGGWTVFPVGGEKGADVTRGL